MLNLHCPTWSEIKSLFIKLYDIFAQNATAACTISNQIDLSACCSEFEKRKIPTPAVYKYRYGDQRFVRYSSTQNGDYYSWRSATIGQILTNRVYTGELVSLKTETQNCKTKHRSVVPADQQIVIPNAHDAIISGVIFDQVQLIRSQHRCPAKYQRENIFRGKLFCECCGHPLTISKKKLADKDADIYLHASL